MFRDVPECSGMFRNVPCSWFYRRPLVVTSIPNGHFRRCMLKHTKRQVNELCFLTCVLLPCLSPQFVCYFLSSYDGQRKRVFTTLFMCGMVRRRWKLSGITRRIYRASTEHHWILASYRLVTYFKLKFSCYFYC